MNTATTPSLYECHRPVERYRELCGPDAAGDGPSPVDAFVMAQVPDVYAAAPLVLDLAADATGGASVALWAAHPRVRHVLAPPSGEAGDWRDDFAWAAGELGIPAERYRLDDVDGVPSGRAGRPVVIHLTLPEDAADDALGRAADLLARHSGSLALVGPLGAVGDSPTLEAALAFCSSRRDLRLSLVREASPFLATSRLGLLAPRESPEAGEALGRLRRAFGGNFQFLSLLRTVTDQAVRLQALEGAGPRGGTQKSRGYAPDAYHALVGRIRRTAGEAIPAGATVLVASKGDEGLLELGGRRGWHFPQTPAGEYAGHHPADGASAVRHLRALRAKGAGYFLVPAPYLWWLEHYAELRKYLETTGRVVTCRPDVCVVYELAPREKRGRAAGSRRGKEVAP